LFMPAYFILPINVQSSIQLQAASLPALAIWTAPATGIILIVHMRRDAGTERMLQLLLQSLFARTADNSHLPGLRIGTAWCMPGSIQYLFDQRTRHRPVKKGAYRFAGNQGIADMHCETLSPTGCKNHASCCLQSRYRRSGQSASLA